MANSPDKPVTYYLNKEKRERTLRLNNYTCVYCQRVSKPENLQVHHKLPQRLGGRHVRTNLTVLCKECHAKWHMHERNNREKYPCPVAAFEAWVQENHERLAKKRWNRNKKKVLCEE